MAILEVIGETAEVVTKALDGFKLTDKVVDYLSELIDITKWEGLDESSKSTKLKSIIDRLAEVGVSGTDNQVEAIKKAYPKQIGNELISLGLKAGLMVGAEVLKRKIQNSGSL